MHKIYAVISGRVNLLLLYDNLAFISIIQKFTIDNKPVEQTLQVVYDGDTNKILENTYICTRCLLNKNVIIAEEIYIINKKCYVNNFEAYGKLLSNKICGINLEFLNNCPKNLIGNDCFVYGHVTTEKCQPFLVAEHVISENAINS